MARWCWRLMLASVVWSVSACAAPRTAPNDLANPWPASSDQRLVIAYQANLLGEIDPCG